MGTQIFCSSSREIPVSRPSADEILTSYRAMNLLALILIFLLVSLVCFFMLRFLLIFQVPETNYAKLEEMNSICKALCVSTGKTLLCCNIC
jgi:hypothetical protein